MPEKISRSKHKPNTNILKMREFGSEYPSVILPDGYFQLFENYNREVTYLCCGREALLYVAINIRQSRPQPVDKIPVVLFPAYCCWSMSAPFIKAGWNVIYYRLNDDLSIDINYLNYLLSAYRPLAVLTMNYYGSADTREGIDHIRRFDHRISIIEDFSHCTFSFASIFNREVDYYVSSLRKSIGIPDGAIVLSKHSTDKSIIQTEDLDFTNKRYKFQTLKNIYSYTKNQEDKSSFLTSLRECEHNLDEFQSVHGISSMTMKMLKGLNGEMIACARGANMRHLWHRLNGHIEMVPGLHRSFEGAPFSLPILVKDRDSIQIRLARKGLYTQLLWPISDEAKYVCSVSKRMNDEMLSVPIDQRYSWDDIEDIANILLTTI